MLRAYCYQAGRPVESLTDAARFRDCLARDDGLLWADVEDPDDTDIECLL